jgi:hypothetical protein
MSRGLRSGGRCDLAACEALAVEGRADDTTPSKDQLKSLGILNFDLFQDLAGGITLANCQLFKIPSNSALSSPGVPDSILAPSVSTETHEQRHFRERIALWLFIAGDALFFLIELFMWFYLRALNTNGLWLGVACTSAHACTDGLGNAITQEVHKASPSFTVTVAGLSVLAALLMSWWSEKLEADRVKVPSAQLRCYPFLVLSGAIGVQCFQFERLPSTTIDGTYASCFIFLMGSTLGHLILLSFVGIGLANRAVPARSVACPFQVLARRSSNKQGTKSIYVNYE